MRRNQEHKRSLSQRSKIKQRV